MGYDETNPNYKNHKKYFPKKYNKELVSGYDSDYMSLPDTQKYTITRKAIKEYAKKYGVTPAKGW
jgi:hypothetical protein